MGFQEELAQFLAETYPGARLVDFDKPPKRGRIGGVIAWPDFDGQSHLDRQNGLWAALRSRFNGDQLRKIRLIMTFTPDELRVLDEG